LSCKISSFFPRVKTQNLPQKRSFSCFQEGYSLRA
jgi:hypothetical protein